MLHFRLLSSPQPLLNSLSPSCHGLLVFGEQRVPFVTLSLDLDQIALDFPQLLSRLQLRIRSIAEARHSFSDSDLKFVRSGRRRRRSIREALAHALGLLQTVFGVGRPQFGEHDASLEQVPLMLLQASGEVLVLHPLPSCVLDGVTQFGDPVACHASRPGGSSVTADLFVSELLDRADRRVRREPRTRRRCFLKRLLETFRFLGDAKNLGLANARRPEEVLASQA
ncbi:MAG: hypothetical protein OXH70_00845 [Acidobacteria bacterium]|nr:hypothetical protein [Acidobacteriota bacterium]